MKRTVRMLLAFIVRSHCIYCNFEFTIFLSVILYEDEILPVMQEEFPFLQLSPHTAKMMWQKQMRQVHTLCKAAQLNRPSKAQKQIEDAQRKQELLSRIIQKELDHNNRLVCTSNSMCNELYVQYSEIFRNCWGQEILFNFLMEILISNLTIS